MYDVDIPVNCNWGEMVIWVQENLNGNWGYMPSGYFSFDTEEDKVKFILRWL